MTLSVRLMKRHKFVLSSLLMAATLAVSLAWPFHYFSLAIVLAVTYLVVIWSLEFDLKQQEWLVLPLYPILLSLCAYLALIWYIPNGWPRWLGVGGYAVGMYGLLLAINILNVATVRGLPLIRQALSVMSLAGISGLFASYYIILSLQPTIWQWAGGVAVASFLLCWPLIWSSTLGYGPAGPTGSQYNLRWTGLVAMLAAQLALVIGFWPVSFMTSLCLAGLVSMVVGVVHYQQNRQVNKTVQMQYLAIGLVLIVALTIFSQWT